MQPSEDPVDPFQALAEGDPAPFEAFVRLQTPLFLAYFRRLGARQTDAEDLTQDVMLRLFRHATQYEGRGQWQAFAFRVARNAWIDHQRRSSLRPRTSVEGGEESRWEPESSEAEPGEVLAQQESREALFAVIAGLGPTHREAFRLGVVEGRPYAEIAKTLGVPVGTVKSRVFHAVQKLRGRLGGGLPSQAEPDSQDAPGRRSS